MWWLRWWWRWVFVARTYSLANLLHANTFLTKKKNWAQMQIASDQICNFSVCVLSVSYGWWNKKVGLMKIPRKESEKDKNIKKNKRKIVQNQKGKLKRGWRRRGWKKIYCHNKKSIFPLMKVMNILQNFHLPEFVCCYPALDS